MSIAPEIVGSTIVAVGSFNPAIFSPDWLLNVGLIGEQDRDAAKGGEALLVSPQMSRFETDWFSLQVLPNQFLVQSKGALTLSFRDLAQGVFMTVPHTPVTAVGLNFMGHYPTGSEAAFHKVGDVLAPKDVWQHAFATAPGGREVGMLDLQVAIAKGKRGEIDVTKDQLRYQVQPSSKIKFGVYMFVNDHRAEFAQATPNAGGAAALVATDWEPGWKDALRVFESVLNGVLAA